MMKRHFHVDKVEVDLALSAHANARRWYEQKKRQENKQEKTIIAHEKAFKAAEKKSCVQLSQVGEHYIHWFEKFNWFISSENYLVISGRDAQQNKMIVKRYMSKGDLFIHFKSTNNNSSSTFLFFQRHLNTCCRIPLNYSSLFIVCHSQAWDSKIVTSAWWVYPHQVSKTASTGEYLTVGSFMIRGKNFLPPHPLMMGFGLLFCLDESSLGSHLNDRRVRGEEEGAQDFEENESLKGNSDSESEKEETDEKRTAESKSIMDPSTHQPILEGFSEISSAHNELTTSNVGSINLPEVPLEERNMLNGNDSEHIDDISGIHVSSVNPQLEDFIDRALELGSNTASGKKYALETSQVDLEEHNHEDRKAKVREKPYTSYQREVIYISHGQGFRCKVHGSHSNIPFLPQFKQRLMLFGNPIHSYIIICSPLQCQALVILFYPSLSSNRASPPIIFFLNPNADFGIFNIMPLSISDRLLGFQSNLLS
ncbi:unnamed protein product, partial [Vitis vinifera]